MGRTIGAVVAGVVLWGVLWNGGSAGLGAAGVITVGEPITAVPVLLGLIAYSAGLSVLAGWVCAVIKDGPDAMTAVKGLAAVNLLIGIAVEVMYWSLMPVWYHLIFLALVVPMTLAGGRMKAAPAGG
jgi:hypothetical protein